MISADTFTDVVPTPSTLDEQTPKDQLLRGEDTDDDLFDDLFLQPAKKREETKFSLRALQSNIKNHRAARYLMDFEESAEYEGVTVSSIPKEVLDERRRLIGAQIRQERELEEKNHAKFLRALQLAEENSMNRIRLWHQATERYKDHFERMKRMKHRQYKRNLGNAFHAANKHFKKVLKQRRAKIRKTYGNLNEFRVQRFAQFKHDLIWRNVPQKIKLNIKFIRGVKDKLPKGYYILLVTLRDRVGGKIVKIKGRKKGEYSSGFYQQTMEIFHDGKHSSLEIVFDQDIFLVSPSQVRRKPYMTFSFELIQTSGPTPGLCCAWGAFPVEDSSFNIISGKYKVPLIRGWITTQIDQYWKYHQECNKNLEKWMGNLYFQVKPLPRERRGRIEREVYVQNLKKLSDVVVQENRNLLSDSSSSDSESDSDSDSESSEDKTTIESDSSSDEFSFSDRESMEELDELKDLELNDSMRPVVNLRNTQRFNEEDLMGFDDEEEDERRPEGAANDYQSFSDDLSLLSNNDNIVPMLKTTRSDKSTPSAQQNSTRSQELDVDYIEEAKPVLRKQRNPAKLEKYKYNLPQPSGYKESLLTFRKGKYLAKALLNDMGISSFDSILTRDFWSTVFLLILSFFLRQYLHFFGQYLLLWIFNVPSVQYYPNFLYVDLDYQSLYLSLWQEILIVVGGVGINMILFTLFILLIMFAQKAGVIVPSFASKLGVLVGFMTLLDPFLVLISDCIFQRWEAGDWFKLYIFYEGQVKGEGFWGIFVTILIYIYLTLITLALMYRFILRIFMNGRIIDVFARVHGMEEDFFVPLDLEVSRDEMDYACQKARKYRGPGGSFHRLVVMEYSLTDPRDQAFFERSIHVIIYSLIPRPGGVYQRKVFRQFLQLENCAIVEIFDDNDAKSLINNLMKSIDSSTVMNFAEDNVNSEKDDSIYETNSNSDGYTDDERDESDLIDSSNVDSSSSYSSNSEELLSF